MLWQRVAIQPCACRGNATLPQTALIHRDTALRLQGQLLASLTLRSPNRYNPALAGTTARTLSVVHAGKIQPCACRDNATNRSRWTSSVDTTLRLQGQHIEIIRRCQVPRYNPALAGTTYLCQCRLQLYEIQPCACRDNAQKIKRASHKTDTTLRLQEQRTFEVGALRPLRYNPALAGTNGMHPTWHRLPAIQPCVCRNNELLRSGHCVPCDTTLRLQGQTECIQLGIGFLRYTPALAGTTARGRHGSPVGSIQPCTCRDNSMVSCMLWTTADTTLRLQGQLNAAGLLSKRDRYNPALAGTTLRIL